MKDLENRNPARLHILLICLGLMLGKEKVFATDNAALVSVSVTNGTPIMPRTMFTQTWTLKNTGTNTWTAGQYGYTLNMVGKDSLGAIALFANASSSWYIPSAIIGGGKSIAPGGVATFSMEFIAPETPGSFTDTFQLNGTNDFGPQVTVQITVPNAGSTNQYDRSRAISYANNYAGYVVTDGYFWTNQNVADEYYFGAGAPVPTAYLGDDCAHFVSCCIGNEPHLRGGGLNIVTRAAPSYGEPGAQRIIYTNLIAAGYAVEVSSLSQLSPGDLIGWNWEGDTNTANIDHVTLYLGNGLLASHAESALDVSATSWHSSGTVWHLIHIYDAPTLGMSHVGTNLMLSWGTNWSGYSLYSCTNLAGSWTKMSKSPTKIGAMNVMTNGIPKTGATFYRLVLP